MTIGKAACLSVSADSSNPSKERVANADVFGRVYDTGGDNALDRDEVGGMGQVESS
jgi:hypothetical protein